MKTNEVRKLVRSVLLSATGVADVYYQRAQDNAMYPHISFTVDRVNLLDLNRQDFEIVVDVWDRGNDDVVAEDIADKVERAFNCSNRPQDTILPTFFLESRRSLPDNDELIRHKQIALVAQNYEV